jgi:hypothetical protein
VSICVDERGGIENSSIKLMKEIENEIMNYYMKEYNISNETMDHIETLGIAYFADTRCLKFMNGILECIPNENKYDMTCCDIAFDLKFIERSFLCYMNDFNQTLFYNKYSDCLIVIPVLYRGTQLVGLNEFVNKFNESNNSNSNSQQTNKVNQHYSQ